MAISSEVVVLVLILLPLIVYYGFKPRPLPSIPCSSHAAAWFKGDFSQFPHHLKTGGNMLGFFETLAMKYGPVCQVIIGPANSPLGWFLGKSFVVLSDSQEAGNIFSKPSEWDKPSWQIDIIGPMIPNGSFVFKTNERFRHHRRWIGPSMTPVFLSRLPPLIVRNTLRLIDAWKLRKHHLGSEPFEPLEDLRVGMFDLVSEVAFGKNFDNIPNLIEALSSQTSTSESAKLGHIPSPLDRVTAGFLNLLQGLASLTDSPLPSLASKWILHAPTKFCREWRADRDRMKDLLKEKLIEGRKKFAAGGGGERKTKVQADNVLEMIVMNERLEREKGVETLDDEAIIDELFFFLLGGQDTTAITAAWGLKFLSIHPNIQKKLHAELEIHFPQDLSIDEFPDYSKLMDPDLCPLLHAVVHEILRLAPTVDVTAREATSSNSSIMGTKVPKGTTVLILTHFLNRVETEGMKEEIESRETKRLHSPERKARRWGFWKDFKDGFKIENSEKWRPEVEFNPYRWLREDGRFDPKMGPWFPFGAGQRGCFGQRLAITVFTYYIFIFNKTFFFDEVPQELQTWRVEKAITTRPSAAWIKPMTWDEVDA